jgi:hypothetical protein
VPTVEFPPVMPFTLKVAFVLASPVIVTLNCAPSNTCTVTLVGVIMIESSGRIVTVALADGRTGGTGKPVTVAFTVTVAGVGTLDGAV